MGYSNETTHYGIPLPTGSDLTTPMDYNESMTDVDVAVFEAKTDSDSALTKAGQLEVALGETNDAVSAIDGRLTEAEGTITSQGQAITNLGLDITDAKQDVMDAICSIVESSATAEYTHEVGTYFWYNDTLYITTVSISIGEQIVPNTNCNTTNVTSEILKSLDTVHTLNQSFNCYYTKSGNCVTLQLEVFDYTPASTSVSVGTLPIGYRPMVPARVFNGANSNPNTFPCNLIINTNGTVNITFKEAVISNCVFCITFFVAS